MATIVITGANRGIGLALAQQLSERGDTVLATCRTKSEELDASGAQIIEGVDVRENDSVERLAKVLDGRKIDILINNAGVLTREGLDDIDWDAMRFQFEINALGPIRMTKALLPNMSSGAKVAIISSRMGSVGDNQAGGSYGYRMSKAAVNMAGSNLAIDLKGRGIAVILLHPGFVATDINDHAGPVNTGDSAHGLIARIDALTLETTGTFRNFGGDELPW